jgi:hypothetical protein
MGAFSSVPAMIGTNQHELQALSPVMPGATPNVTLTSPTPFSSVQRPKHPKFE